jgi:hypothetical protein
VVEDADEASELIGLVTREGFAAGAAMFKGASGDDDFVEVFQRETG